MEPQRNHKSPGHPATPQAENRRAATQPVPPSPRWVHPQSRHGRGTLSNTSGRFEQQVCETVDDGWNTIEDAPSLRTEVTQEKASTIISRNTSPDIPFSQSLNPYRGCEHGCTYCFARPTHAYMGLSPGLDFESRLFAKTNAPVLLEKEITRKGYKPRPLMLGANTDPYQPVERTYRITRRVLEVLSAHHHSVCIVTKSALVTRDTDLLASMAERGLVKVSLSITTLDRQLSRIMEPRAAAPAKRLETLEKLTAAGIPVAVMAAPMIPALNDHELERILTAAHHAGAREAAYIVLRMPREVADLFKQWLHENLPDRAGHVIAAMRRMRGGKDYDSQWGKRMTGEGPFAWLLKRRFDIACRKLGLNGAPLPRHKTLCTTPKPSGEQLTLFES